MNLLETQPLSPAASNPDICPTDVLAIELDGVTREYAGHAGVVRALDHAVFSVKSGEWVAITGPSGSGKSTLVNLLGCLDRPTAGSLRIGGTDTSKMSPQELDRFRAEKIGFIFQQFHLIPYLTSLENVMLAQYFHSMTDEKEALTALERVGLADRAQHLPSELSGGEQQRVCIARALINNPPILLADEPTGNLDAENQKIVANLLKDLHRHGHTIVMVTHDPQMADLASRKIALSHGKVVCQPSTESLVELK
ncbi:MAG: ABC transporter ATP-binding protein [Acidobacteriaceae bacterium]